MAKRILYGVLNWGLGHASRSAVIIKELERKGFQPVIASDGLALEYLRREFPRLESRELPPYGVSYSKSNNQWPSLIASLPKIAVAAKKEKQLVEYWAEEDGFSGVISDNRLGFFHSETPSVYLSHQLRPLAGMFTSVAKRAHAKFYKHYQQIWVPDTPLSTLSGKLSKIKHPGLRYIGPISTLKQTDHKRGDKILVVLSGPEPQRTILETQIFEQAESYKDELVVVRGTHTSCDSRYQKEFKVFDLLGSEDLSRLIAESKLVVSRSGYSSIMDYYHLGKQALLIPTPGQTEQEYLAKSLKANGYFHTVSQSKLQLIEDVEKALAHPCLEAQDNKLPEDLFSLF